MTKISRFEPLAVAGDPIDRWIVGTLNRAPEMRGNHLIGCSGKVTPVRRSEAKAELVAHVQGNSGDDGFLQI